MKSPPPTGPVVPGPSVQENRGELLRGLSYIRWYKIPRTSLFITELSQAKVAKINPIDRVFFSPGDGMNPVLPARSRPKMGGLPVPASPYNLCGGFSFTAMGAGPNLWIASSHPLLAMTE